MSCAEVPTEYKRNSPLDPFSLTFDLQKPTNFKASFMSDSTIRISWDTNDPYATHNYLEKSLNGEIFVPLDTLKAQSDLYIDNSKEFNSNTIYLLRNFRELNGSFFRSEPVTTRIKFTTDN